MHKYRLIAKKGEGTFSEARNLQFGYPSQGGACATLACRF